MIVPDRYQINDSRPIKNFSEKTFSGYLRKDVLAIFQKSIINYKVEDACNWLVELVISGQTDKVWDKIFTIAFKTINTNSPSLPNYLYTRYALYNSLIKHENYQKNILLLRNNQIIRNHLAEIVVNLSTSDKEKPINLTKITKNYLFLDNIKNKFQAKDTRFIDIIYQAGDPKEIKIIVNEFVYSINNNFKESIFWLSWLLEWEKLNIKKNKTYPCAHREITNVEQKYWNELVWLIWEIILKLCINKDVDFLNLQIQSLYKLFKFNYSPSKKTKKIPIIIYALKLINDNYNISAPISKKYYITLQATCKINIIFLEKKTFEILDQNAINILKQNALSSTVIRNEEKETKPNKKSEKDKPKVKKAKISDETIMKFDILGKIDQRRINTQLENSKIIKKQKNIAKFQEVKTNTLKNLPLTPKESKTGDDFIREIENLLKS